MKTIKIEGLYELAYRAFSNISFYPEKRAEQIVSEFEGQLSNDCENMPEHERAEYITNYTNYLRNWLVSQSKCFSVMITGGSNFNNERHEKNNRAERARMQEFTEWRERALKSIAKRLEQSKPIEQRANEKWESLKRQISQKIEWGSVVNCVSMIERLAYNGEVELVQNCLNLISEYNSNHSRPFVTAKNKVWQFVKIAEKARAKNEGKKDKESKEIEINGIRIVENYEADRLQMFFDGKPDSETISKLKHNAFKWSPSNSCWQRQLTSNAIYGMRRVLNLN